ncbi:hypothetical protein KCP71_17445 [Salmonella enterica subsp. enterica]|nr:hypothetical protein KCP71_17445 [Salmonella enterica subsp. enterica]
MDFCNLDVNDTPAFESRWACMLDQKPHHRNLFCDAAQHALALLQGLRRG